MTTRIIALVLVVCAAGSYLEYRRAAPAYAQPAPIAAAAPAGDIAPASDMEGVVFSAADEFGVSRPLAHAILMQESGGNPGATSAVGAAGLMQVMPGTAAGIATDLGVGAYDIYDPTTNARFGMYYLSQKVQRYGESWGLAAYNWGPGAVDEFLSRHPDAATMEWGTVLAAYGGDIPGETQSYVTSILAAAAQAQAPDDARARLVSYALSLQGIPYVRGGRSASGGDCSGTMQHIYLTVTGIDIGGTTFSQYPQLAPVDAPEPGDLAYFWQFSDGDEHVGMVADVDGDGVLDLINNGGLEHSMHVDYSFMSIPYFSEHFKGYRRVL